MDQEETKKRKKAYLSNEKTIIATINMAKDVEYPIWDTILTIGNHL